MKAVLSIVLNPTVPFAKLANAVGHLCLGLGKDIDKSKAVEVAIRIAPSRAKMYEIRSKFASLADGNLLPAKVVDFTDTMTGETFVEQLEKTANTVTSELEYYAVASLTTEEVAKPILDSCITLPEYADQEISVGGDEVILARSDMPESPENVGLSIVLDKKTVSTDILLGIAISSLTMGANIPVELLKLLNFKDKDGVVHPQISAHSYVMLQSKNSTQLKALADDTKDEATGLVGYVNNEPPAVCLFGYTEKRRAATNKCSLLKGSEPLLAPSLP